jgi:hypothetical protein
MHEIEDTQVTIIIIHLDFYNISQIVNIDSVVRVTIGNT